MGKTTPSGITAGQISKIQGNLGDALRTSGLSSELVQQMLEAQGDTLTAELLAVISSHVSEFGHIIVRSVLVNRNREPQQALDTLGRVQYTSESIVAIMPRGERSKCDVFFFKASRSLSDPELEEEFNRRGLKPDPYAQIQANADDPAFADDHPNSSHWKDDDGCWCFVAFRNRDVVVNRCNNVWDGDWWFAGVPK